MLIKLNGVDLTWEARDGATLGDALEDIVKNRFLKDEFISSIAVNGDTIAEGDVPAAKLRPITEVTLLDLKTDTFRKASISALESIGEYLDGLAGMVKVAAGKFRADNEADANDYFVGCIDGLQTFVGIVDKIKTLNSLDFEKMTFNAKPIMEKEAALLASLNSIFQTQSKKDWVSLADILEFELAPLISEWKDITEVVAKTLREK